MTEMDLLTVQFALLALSGIVGFAIRRVVLRIVEVVVVGIFLVGLVTVLIALVL